MLREERGITPAMAAKLGRLFGNGPGIRLRMQRTVDRWHQAG
jgi:plasmid maintenance system antidote protein VapI